MTSPTLPVSRLVNVTVNLTPSAAAAQNLSTLLLLGSSNIIDSTERFRTYSTIDEVAADFGTSLPEYLAAVLWFEQSPQPASLMIGLFAATPTPGFLRGATLSAAQQSLTNFTSITDGKFTYTLNGGSPTTTAAINFTGALNLPAIAALITAQTTGVTFTWNSNYQRFEAVTTATGATASLSFLSTPATGTDISGLLGMQSGSSGAYLAQGLVAETPTSCVGLFDLDFGQTFYGISFAATVADADVLLVAAFVEAAGNKHVYFVTTQEAGVLVASYTADIAYQLQQFKYRRTWVQFSSNNPYAAVSAAARMLTTDYTGNNTVITLMYKQEPGIVPENLNINQVNALEAKNCNVFVAYNNNTAIIEQGKTSSGFFLDVITGTDWLSLTIQQALYNLLYTSATKIPQTDAGSQLMVVTIESVCAQGVINGLGAPGVWDNAGFGNLAQGDYLQKGYYVYAPKVSSQNSADRAARKAVPIQVAFKLAGAVHTIAMVINVNQ